MDQIGSITERVLAQVNAKRAVSDERVYVDGKITEPGIYNDVDIERYHNDTALFDRWSISSSGLKMLIERPSLYWAHCPFNENRQPAPDTQPLKFGRAAHMLLLGEMGFWDRYVKRPNKAPDGRDWNGNNLSCREWLSKQEATGKWVITQADLDTIKYMAESLAKDPVIRDTGVLNGRIERTMVTHIGSVALRARPDSMPISDGNFGDLKTAADLSDDALQKAVSNNGLHIQAASVRRVARDVMPAPFEFGEYVLVFCEKTPPYDIRVMVLKEHDIDLGERQLTQGLKTLERCISENHWPGVSGWDGDAGFLEMPSWARTRIENSLIGENA
ncbi:MAG: PD-(D/E)XK nuclease-like domain-containing protein [Pseudomonadota bacterium]